MSGPLSLPDDTVEFDVDQPADRPIGLMIGIGVLTLLVLLGLGYLIFGNLTGGGEGSGVGLGGPGSPTAIDGPPSDSPSPEATDPTTPVPVAATTPATTPATKPTTQSPTPSPSTSTAAVSLSVVNGAMRPRSYTGADCPGSTLAQATVVVGGPVTITYHWNYAINGKQGATPPAAFQFTAAGSHPFSYLFSDLAMPSGIVTASLVVTAPVNRRAAMQYTQECGASASDIVAKPANPKCGAKVVLSSTMSAGVGPMRIGFRWHVPGAISPPHVGTWDVPPGGGQKPVPDQTVFVAKDQKLTVTLILDRVSPPAPSTVSLTYQTSITLTCTP